MLAATTVPILIGASLPTQAREGAERVAAALRFARDESLRTARSHGVSLTANTDSDTLKVFVLDTSTLPPTPQFSVRHPLSRQDYAETLGNGSPFPAARADGQGFVSAMGSTSQLLFTADGAPALLNGANLLRLSGASVWIRINAGAHSQNVLVATETGRVTLQ